MPMLVCPIARYCPGVPRRSLEFAREQGGRFYRKKDPGAWVRRLVIFDDI